ncbi:MAG: gliding motility lipoprotein GldB [Flavobacterium sp.]|nr:MAG: gliding motility lipoprotein GldB [Flavobacterium sp.]
MKKIFILFFLFIAITSCDKKSKAEKAVDEIPMDVKVERFDKAFFETKPQDLNQLKKKYPMFFPTGNDDNVWLEKMNNPMWRELYSEVQKKYSNFEPQKAELEEVLKHIKYYYPKTKTPKIITVISEMDYHNKVIYADSLVLVALELYLGKDHKFYEFPKYLTQNFEPRQMAPDLATAFLERKIPPPDNSLISQMVYYGKELYMKDLLLPDYNDAEKIGYKPEQIAWCEEYESYIWRYFVEEKLLYSTDGKLPNRFVNPAPFSKFYLEIDNDSPGRVGQWIGWQIVRSFMENNNIAPQEMLKLDAREIFERSHYKPKKINEQE